jgi:glycosyltransferase involved in cell wall biosynthesis
MSDKVSVIIPCYNVEKYIERCLESLERQTIGIGHMEIICVDDASSDGTEDILRSWEKKYPGSIKVVLSERNNRQGAARNIGMQYASGDWVSFVDSDDNFSTMKAVLEGSLIQCPKNAVIYATSNRKHLVRESFQARMGDEIHLNDTINELTSLSDRFGINLLFQKPNLQNL